MGVIIKIMPLVFINTMACMTLLIFLYVHLDVLTEQFCSRDGFEHLLCELCIHLKGNTGQLM